MALNLVKPVKGAPDWDAFLNGNFQEIMDYAKKNDADLENTANRINQHKSPLIWYSPTFVNGFEEHKTDDMGLKFARDEWNNVYLQGWCWMQATTPVLSRIFTLPVGFRPQKYYSANSIIGTTQTLVIGLHGDGLVYVASDPAIPLTTKSLLTIDTTFKAVNQ